MYENSLTRNFIDGLNVLELFCVTLYTDFLSNLYKKFQVAFTYDTNVEC